MNAIEKQLAGLKAVAKTELKAVAKNKAKYKANTSFRDVKNAVGEEGNGKIENYISTLTQIGSSLQEFDTEGKFDSVLEHLSESIEIFKDSIEGDITEEDIEREEASVDNGYIARAEITLLENKKFSNDLDKLNFTKGSESRIKSATRLAAINRIQEKRDTRIQAKNLTKKPPINYEAYSERQLLQMLLEQQTTTSVPRFPSRD